jgi:hypothetical protein
LSHPDLFYLNDPGPFLVAFVLKEMKEMKKMIGDRFLGHNPDHQSETNAQSCVCMVGLGYVKYQSGEAFSRLTQTK